MAQGTMGKKDGEDSTVHAYDNVWRGCLPLSEARLADAEANAGGPFPGELRELFLRCNGGSPEKSYFENDRIMVEIGRLLPVDPPKSWRGPSFEDVLVQQRSMGLPSTLVPFALDTGNAGVFCVDRESGEVSYWIHDQPEDPLKKVAASLDDVLSNLTEPPY